MESAFGEGGLDVLVNNAGWLERFVPMGESDVDEWWYTWEVNIRGLYLVTRAFLPLVLKSKEKTIVNLSSIGAHMTRPGVSAYLCFCVLLGWMALKCLVYAGIGVSVGKACRPAFDGVHDGMFPSLTSCPPVSQSIYRPTMVPKAS